MAQEFVDIVREKYRQTVAALEAAEGRRRKAADEHNTIAEICERLQKLASNYLEAMKLIDRLEAAGVSELGEELVGELGVKVTGPEADATLSAVRGWRENL